jgi:uncharacterized protein (TIGR03435 family)
MRLRGLAVAGLAALGAAAQPAFDVASVKPAIPQLNAQGNYVSRFIAEHGKVTITPAIMRDIVMFAYGLNPFQVVGPDWISSKTVFFEIRAAAPAETPREQLLLMLQNLLAERFHMDLHREQRPMPAYALVVARNGLKIRGTANDTAPQHVEYGRGLIVNSRMPLAALADLLSRNLRLPVLDLTGLAGPFDIKLEWMPDDPAMRPPDADPASGPSLFTAVQEQLGLRLESRKGPVEVLVIDRADKVPTEN